MENKQEGLANSNLQSEIKLTPAQEIAKLNQETVQNTMNRREFFAKFIGKESKEQTDQELSKVRGDLQELNQDSEKPEEFPSDEISSDEPAKKTKWLFTRRNMIGALLVGVIAFKWDFVRRFLHQWERKEYPKGLAGVIEGIKDEYPHVDQEADPEMWSREIENAFPASGLPRTTENLGTVLSLITAESGFRSVPRAYDQFDVDNYFDEEGLPLVDAPSTGGPMELAYQHVVESEQVTLKEAMELMSRVPEGLTHSFRHLNTVIQAYQEVSDLELRLKCIFADWNSGTYSSRNAGVQRVVSELSGQKLNYDGLIGEKTKSAVRDLLAKNNITVDTLEEDLKWNRAERFKSSNTWKALETLYNGPITPVVADTPVLGLYGWTKEVTTGISSSGEFADARYEEYQKISKLMEKFGVN